jgi:hypothetical protein
MKLSTLPVLAAALLALTLSTHAQDAEPGAGRHATRAAHHYGVHHRWHDSAHSAVLGAPVNPPPEVSSPAGQPLPSVFRNCEHPAPWWCTRDY